MLYPSWRILLYVQAGYGTGGKNYTLKNYASRFAYLDNGVNARVRRIETVGRGEIVYFVDDPIFRGFWEAGKLVLSNAIFMVRQ
ncbi:hypothetical protein U3A58_01195 [Algoriphagus sp. C2-6-M1]|uniref:hypothetical protein n=1 Tax=Algoriphagus persicinus TaxID=3108754 RepID=UPI002B3FF8A8|nr:hypothetical protein [Algoriphagus sp. C2-6-M1]MEB2778990.1 hypothetical protein [Algoriphagus sp. C2-6-M1]